MKNLKGFTIVELLIVVAIITVLAGIVLINVLDYINKGKDASIKSNLSSVLTSGAVHLDENDNYTDFCTSEKVINAQSAILEATGFNIVSVCTDTTWCACSPLKTAPADVFCVDHLGTKKIIPATNCTDACTSAGVCI